MRIPTNGKAENDGERLEMEQIERQVGGTKVANEEPGMLQATALKCQDSMDTVSFQCESGVYVCIAECDLKLMRGESVCMEFPGQQYVVIMILSKEFQKWYRSPKELDEIMQTRASKVDITFSVQGCSGTGNVMSKLRESKKPMEVRSVSPIEEQIDEMDKILPQERVQQRTSGAECEPGVRGSGGRKMS